MPGLPTSGAGLRAWGLGKGLKAHGFEVDFAMPTATTQIETSQTKIDHDVLLWDPYNLEHLIHNEHPDAVVFCHWPSVQIKKRLDVPTVIDLHGPHLLERAFQNLGQVGDNALRKIEAFRKADYFICAGEKQKPYFLAWLLASGINVTRKCLDVVPVCLSPDLPSPRPSVDSIKFVYGGVYLPWQNPTLGLTTVAKVLKEQNTGTLHLFGGSHPLIPIDIPPIFQEIEEELQDYPRVHFEGMHPHDELITTYLRATVAIDLMQYNYERELAFTTRTVEYMWCGLPVIYNNYAELAPLIREYEAGWVLDPTDRKGIEDIIHTILNQPNLAYERGRNAQRLVLDHLTWDQAVKPLAAFLKEPQINTYPVEDLPTSVASAVGVKRFWSRWSSVGRKGIKKLLSEAFYHLKKGGVSDLISETLNFVRRRLNLQTDRKE
jgi:glycosyltransferase involved in cell wall biosynthesis